MAIEKDVVDQLLAGRDPKDVFSKDGLVDELKKALSERILSAEIDEHLDGEGGEGKSNHRNGYSKKSVLTGTSKMTLAVPRDRAGTFDPKLIAKYQGRFPDFDEKIISMYARGIPENVPFFGVHMPNQLALRTMELSLRRGAVRRQLNDDCRCVIWFLSLSISCCFRLIFFF